MAAVCWVFLWFKQAAAHCRGSGQDLSTTAHSETTCASACQPTSQSTARGGAALQRASEQGPNTTAIPSEPLGCALQVSQSAASEDAAQDVSSLVRSLGVGRCAERLFCAAAVPFSPLNSP